MRLTSVAGSFVPPTQSVDVDKTAGCSKLCTRLISWEIDAMWLSTIASTPCTCFSASSNLRPIRQIFSAMLVVSRSQFNTLPSKIFNSSTDLSNGARCELNSVTSFNTPSSCRFNSVVACSYPWREFSTFALRASATWGYSKAAPVACSSSPTGTSGPAPRCLPRSTIVPKPLPAPSRLTHLLVLPVHGVQAREGGLV